MEFLKDILGEDLYNQFTEKVNAYNGDEANKDKQVKIANLASGEYIGKGKYDALEQTLTGKNGELESANNLIAELKKSNKGNESLQSKISEYETQVAELQQELEQTRIKSAVKLALLKEKALDVDYLTFKLESKLKDDNKTLELDENDNIRNWNDMLSGLKTQCPNMFETGANGAKVYDATQLPAGDRTSTTLTRSEVLRMPYRERAELQAKNPDAYNEAMKG